MDSHSCVDRRRRQLEVLMLQGVVTRIGQRFGSGKRNRIDYGSISPRVSNNFRRGMVGRLRAGTDFLDNTLYNVISGFPPRHAGRGPNLRVPPRPWHAEILPVSASFRFFSALCSQINWGSASQLAHAESLCCQTVTRVSGEIGFPQGSGSTDDSERPRTPPTHYDSLATNPNRRRCASQSTGTSSCRPRTACKLRCRG